MADELARRAAAAIKYRKKRTEGKKDVTKLLAKKLVSVSYTDSAEGEGDELSIELEDRDKKFLSGWRPRKGAYMSLVLKTSHWEKPGKETKQPCGEFVIDKVSYDSPPWTCEIGGTSKPNDSDFTAKEREDRTYEGTTLEKILKEIAGRYGMSLFYDAEKIPIASVEQGGKTDCAFACSLCEEYGLGMKVYADKLVAYGVKRYEAKKAVRTIPEKRFVRCDIDDSLSGTYTGAEGTYTDDSGGEHAVKIGKAGRTYAKSVTAGSIADMRRKLTAAVNLANREAVKMELEIFPIPSLSAARCVRITGVGDYSGKYFIDSVTHKVSGSGGYTQKLKLHKVQEWIGG